MYSTIKKNYIPFYLGQDPDMFIEEQFRNCVSFLYVDKQGAYPGEIERVPQGSAFFVSIPVGNNEGAFHYAVTANHVIDLTRSLGKLYIRMNKKQGGIQDFGAPHDAWVAHPQTDIALIPMSVPPGIFDYRTIDTSWFISDEHIKEKAINVGDDVFFVGLFSEYYEQESVSPIVRFGNMSLMPKEKVRITVNPYTHTTKLVDAFLVEARSWGGHSGSPAFIRYSVERPRMNVKLGGGTTALLGLVQGHSFIKQDVIFAGDIDLDEKDKLKVNMNAGMAIILPASKIMEILMMDELIDQRERALNGIRSRRPASEPDIIVPTDN